DSGVAEIRCATDRRKTKVGDKRKLEPPSSWAGRFQKNWNRKTTLSTVDLPQRFPHPLRQDARHRFTLSGGREYLCCILRCQGGFISRRSIQAPTRLLGPRESAFVPITPA